MTQPKLARQIQFGRFDKTRIYTIDGNEFPSVTSIIGMMDKPALVPWAAKMAATYAVSHREAITLLDDDDAVQLIKSNWRKARDKAADFGSAVHQMIEQGVTPDSEDPAWGYVNQAAEMLSDWGITVDAAEVTVAHPAHSYAGTVDVLAHDREGVALLLDWKTGKGTYLDSHGMQLVALAEATHTADPTGELIHIPEDLAPQYGLTVRLAEDGYEVKGVTRGSDVWYDLYQAFIGLIDVWVMKRNRHRWDIG